MTSSVIAADGALRPCFPRALHVCNELASDFLTDENISLPLYCPFVKQTDELERVVTFVPFLDHSNATIGINGLLCAHLSVARFPFLTVTLL